jgi:hypothetical protein
MIKGEELPQGWLVLAFGDERQYAGNTGYDDVRAEEYRYDTSVPNHTKVGLGDVLVVRGPTLLEGFARVVEIESRDAVKERLRCPTCRTTAIKARERQRVRFRCDKGHEFDVPLTESVAVTQFTALFGRSYLPAHGELPLDVLRAACPRWNGQLAIQAIDLAVLREQLDAIPGFLARVIEQRPSPVLAPTDAANSSGDAPYVPGGEDTRESALRTVTQRRGQAAFRNALLLRYGARCIVSECDLLELLEAAHIHPYRGADDHHPENGLMLRADIHTLFDLDLVGIEPKDLTVRIHPAAAASGYELFDGRQLQFGPLQPSRSALELRWAEFRRRLGESMT